MRKIAALVGLMLTTAAPGFTGRAVAQTLERVAETPLPDYARGFNILDADEKRGHLFMATAHNGAVLVFDLKSGALLKTLHDVTDPHMLAYIKSRDEIWASDAKGSCVTVLSAADYHLLRKIPLTTSPTVGFYDAAKEVFYIQEAGMNSGMPTSIIDVIPAGATSPTLQITIDDKNLEGMVVDHRRNRLYVNMRDHRQIAAVDLATGKVVETWTIAGMGKNTPMAIDEAGGRLFVAAREPAKLFAIDLKTGRATFETDIMSTPDALTWDPASKRLFLSGLEGIAVFSGRMRDRLDLVSQTVDPGVKHSLLLPGGDLLYAAAAKTETTPAALHIYRVARP
ncbi:YncE family protein [Sphingomonas nostoxanthinifaciens]|uniref:YncE family protein n=1 Tax=Sphingomonas nostoxanthinifaciens TaxID=2872652 RepID=UPI001CC1D3B8|nr:PQQ-binding-like beta-propeller repeat protein [Sphingomonas nostoxanthinifaciens]UAK25794.1 PQQ-binding-like beta-propeller repeat protein [Sphingomonas nostoxanthinifaciens]